MSGNIPWRGFADWNRERNEVFLGDFSQLLGRTYRPNGHWCSYPRKWKRAMRIKANQFKPRLKSKGWRKHVRAWKAKQ